jgi:hypothetical protein
LNAVVLDDVAVIFLRAFAGILGRDCVESFLGNEVLGDSGRDCAGYKDESECQRREDSHAGKSTTKRSVHAQSELRETFG